MRSVPFGRAGGRLVDGVEIVFKCTNVHIWTESMRAKRWIASSHLFETAIAQSPILMAIVESSALVATRMQTLHILSGITVIRLHGVMIEPWSRHVAC